MKKIAILVFIFLVSGCQGTGGSSTTTLKIPASTFDSARTKLKNDSVSSTDIIFANMQNVPIPPIGISRRQVESFLANKGLDIIEASDQELLVLGSSKSIKRGNSRISATDVDTFSYKFEDGLLISGPNVVAD